jgi:hypothetical protein
MVGWIGCNLGGWRRGDTCVLVIEEWPKPGEIIYVMV